MDKRVRNSGCACPGAHYNVAFGTVAIGTNAKYVFGANVPFTPCSVRLMLDVRRPNFGIGCDDHNSCDLPSDFWIANGFREVAQVVKPYSQPSDSTMATSLVSVVRALSTEGYKCGVLFRWL